MSNPRHIELCRSVVESSSQTHDMGLLRWCFTIWGGSGEFKGDRRLPGVPFSACDVLMGRVSVGDVLFLGATSHSRC